jgi:serine/threonine protein kinase
VIATIMRYVLMGLEYVHKNGGIHRDVKVSSHSWLKWHHTASTSLLVWLSGERAAATAIGPEKHDMTPLA